MTRSSSGGNSDCLTSLSCSSFSSSSSNVSCCFGLISIASTSITFGSSGWGSSLALCAVGIGWSSKSASKSSAFLTSRSSSSSCSSCFANGFLPLLLNVSSLCIGLNVSSNDWKLLCIDFCGRIGMSSRFDFFGVGFAPSPAPCGIPSSDGLMPAKSQVSCVSIQLTEKRIHLHFIGLHCCRFLLREHISVELDCLFWKLGWTVLRRVVYGSFSDFAWHFH